MRNLLNKFFEIFKDDNTYNEKTVIGFLAFSVMVIVMLVDMFADIPVTEFIYNSFVLVTLGSFGIAGIEKFANRK